MAEPEMIPIKLEKKSVEERLCWAMAEIHALKIRVEQLEAKPKTGNKRGERLSEDWVLDDAGRQYAREYGFTEDEIDLHEIQFKNYWLSASGQNACKKDWPRTWQNRVIELARREGKERRTAAQGQSGHQDSPAPESKHTRAAVEALAANLMPVESDLDQDKLERHRMARQIRDAYVGQSNAPCSRDQSILAACGKIKVYWLTGAGQAERAAKIAQEHIERQAAKLDIGRERFAWPAIK